MEVKSIVVKILKVFILSSLLTLSSCSEPSYQRCVIKGNVSSYGGQLIYHLPGQRYYDATIPERWFCTERDAIAAGYRKAKV
jgi:hypothetical protein